MELIIRVLNDEDVESNKLGSDSAGVPGSEAKGSLTLYPLQMETIYFLQDMLVRGNLDKREHLELLGKHLYNVLIDKDIASHYQECLREAKSKGEKLKVKLAFSETAGDLANLPWEYLYYPGSETEEGTFLATEVELTLSRFIPLKNPPDSRPKDQLLKVLLAMSQPEGLGSKTPAVVHEVLEKLKSSKGITVEYLDKPTKDNLEAALVKHQPHVLHFVGSGRVERRTGKGEVALLEDDETSLDWCPAKLFADLVGSKGVRAVFLELSLRDGTSMDFDQRVYRESFTGMAEPLVKANIQSVVAMQFPVPDDVAAKFVKIFYETLASGEMVSTAVQSGRRVMPRIANYYDTGVFGTPMLFICREDNIVNPAMEVRTSTFQVEVTEKIPVEEKAGQVQVLPKTPVDMMTVASRESINASLGPEQTKTLGMIYSELFQAPDKMESVLLAYLQKCDDARLQGIIVAMIRELGGGR